MLKIFSWFVIGFVLYILDCYALTKIVNIKFRFNPKLIITCLVCSLCSYILLFYINDSILAKIIITNLCAFTVLKINFNEGISKTILITLFIYICYVFSDILFGTIAINILEVNKQFLLETQIGFILSNFVIMFICTLLFKIKRLTSFLRAIVEWYNNNDFLKLITVTLFTVFCITFLSYWTFIGIDSKAALGLVTLLFFIGVLGFILGYFREKTGNNKLTIEYAELLEYAKNYEKIVVEKSKNQHEYKNQLVLIKEKISDKDIEVKKYINKLLNSDDKEDKNYAWLGKLKNIPERGLKGLIYYKIQRMIEKDICVYVDISDKLSDESLWITCNDNLEDLSRIIGVYLDNAIEATLSANEKYIVIEIDYNVNKLVFSFSNTYIGNIDVSRIDKEGYTTKQKGHGYGLSLVKDIISKNNLLENSSEINGKFFIQKFAIKNKI